jgi:GNAT superfamily N-acetyltransferase
MRDTPFTLRPVRSADAPALRELFEALSPLARQRRFHGAVAGLTPDRLRRMTGIDPRREAAIVVLMCHAQGEHLVADARFVVDASGSAAEFAIVVAEGWRDLGIGTLALAGLQGAASERGLRWLYGSVLADNAPMLALLRRCGFHCVPNRRDARLIVAEWHAAAPVPAVPPRAPGRLFDRLRATFAAKPGFSRQRA